MNRFVRRPTIQVEAKFNSFDEFRAVLDEWMEENYCPFRVASSEILRDFNGEYEQICRYRYIVYHCVHYGQPRRRGSGKRPNQTYIACGCTAALRLNYSFTEKCLRITTLHNEHNHEMNAETFSEHLAKIRKQEDGEITPQKKTPRRQVKSENRTRSASGDSDIDTTPRLIPTSASVRRRLAPSLLSNLSWVKEEETDEATVDESINTTLDTPDDSLIDVVNNDTIEAMLNNFAPPAGLPAPVPQYAQMYNPLLTGTVMMPPYMLAPFPMPYPVYTFIDGQQFNTVQQQAMEVTENKENVGPVETSGTASPQFTTLQPVKCEDSPTQGYDPSLIQSLQHQLMNPQTSAERQAELKALLDKWGNQSPTSPVRMRGAVVTAFGGPEHIEIRRDLPAPVITQPDQVLIDMRAAGVNPIDTYIRAGTFDRLPQLPFVPGFDGAGVVREIGSSVTHLRVGDRVWFFAGPTGATSEVAVASYAFPLPKELSFVDGACLGIPYPTAHRALFTKGHFKKGERVLIHGASGGVGLAACQMARLAQASLVVGTAGTEEGLAVVRRNGAHYAVCHRDEGYVERLKEIAPDGFDLILEMAADTNLNTDFDLLAREGRVGIVGGRGCISITPRTLYVKELTAYGVVLYGAKRADLFECADMMERLFSTTEYRPVCGKFYSLEATAQCHRDMNDSSLPTVGNRVIVVKE